MVESPAGSRWLSVSSYMGVLVKPERFPLMVTQLQCSRVKHCKCWLAFCALCLYPGASVRSRTWKWSFLSVIVIHPTCLLTRIPGVTQLLLVDRQMAHPACTGTVKYICSRWEVNPEAFWRQEQILEGGRSHILKLFFDNSSVRKAKLKKQIPSSALDPAPSLRASVALSCAQRCSPLQPHHQGAGRALAAHREGLGTPAILGEWWVASCSWLCCTHQSLAYCGDAQGDAPNLGTCCYVGWSCREREYGQEGCKSSPVGVEEMWVRVKKVRGGFTVDGDHGYLTR